MAAAENGGKKGKSNSIARKLNTRLFLRLLSVFLCMDVLLVALALGGMFLWAESRCAQVAALVAERGVPTQETIPWMEASDYTITPLDRAPEGFPLDKVLSWLPTHEETADGLRTYEIGRYYRVELPNGGEPYAIQLDLTGPARLLLTGGIVLAVCQILSLVSNLLRNASTIRRTLRPIQELAATAARLNSMAHMSRQELEALAGELDKINATHLDSRIDLPGTQKELQSLAAAINGMLDRVNGAYRSQMRFVSDASHELRTPIAVIQGYANLLDRWGKDDPAVLQESIEAIRSEADSMKKLVEQLLFLARGDNDTVRMEPEILELTALAGEVAREMEMIDQTHAFTTRWTGPAYIYGDDGLIKQALRVLTDNSVKYSPEGSTITLSVEQDGRWARLSVQDQGQGMGAASLPHIFERFYRTDESRTRQTGGTGLGLAIAKWIVDRHGGHIEVWSFEGVGTRMTIVLPGTQPAGEESA